MQPGTSKAHRQTNVCTSDEQEARGNRTRNAETAP